MFELYVSGRTQRGRKSRGLAFAASALVNASLVGGLLLWSFWKIERVHSKGVPVVFHASTAPPPPPPPAAPPPAPAQVARAKVPKVRELVQPTAAPTEPVAAPETPSEPSTGEGPPDGVPGGIPGSTGSPGGTGDAPGEPPIVEIVNVPIDGVEAMRISGTREIPLPRDVKLAAIAQGKRHISAGVKLCIDPRGVPSRVQVLGSTGFPEADEKLRAEVSAWRYRPYRVNGHPVSACTAVMFRYEIED